MFSSTSGRSILGLRIEPRSPPVQVDDVHVDAFRDVLGGAGRALARLVVGVGVDVHQTQHAGNLRMKV